MRMAMIFLLLFGFLLVGCDTNDALGKVVPDVITDSVGLSGDSWHIQATGSGSKSRNFTLDAAQLLKVKADNQFVGGSAKLTVTQTGVSPKTTVIHDKGISQGTVDIDMTGFNPGVQLTMKVEVTNISGGQTTISWE